MSITIEQIVRQLGDLVLLRDWDAVREILAENAVYHIPGHNPLSGTYRGVDDVLAFLGRWADHLDAVPASVSLLLTSKGDQRVVLITQRTAMVNGEQRQWIEKIAFFFHGQRIAACWLFVDNLADFDAYFTSGPGQPPSNLRTRPASGATYTYSFTA